MPRIPAICEACGKVTPSNVWLKDATCHVSDHREGDCDCGGSIVILDGTYTHLGGPINLCNASEEKIARFKRMCEEAGC